MNSSTYVYCHYTQVIYKEMYNFYLVGHWIHMCITCFFLRKTKCLMNKILKTFYDQKQLFATFISIVKYYSSFPISCIYQCLHHSV